MARILRTAAFVVLAAAAVTSLVSAQPPRPPMMPSSPTTPACNTDGTSANIQFSISGANRVIRTNFCPNHPIRTINPNAAHENSHFGVTDQNYPVPAAPTLAPSSQIINLTCVPSAVGFARTGAVFFSVFPGTCGSDAVIAESNTFDECGGHSEQTGMYHYHMTPSCALTAAGGTNTAHSPILGYMVDGIPVYGPLTDRGAVPTDLDACGGHASDTGNGGHYHYHLKPIKGTWPDPATPVTDTSGVGAGWPYTPGCLRGCVPDTYLSTLSSYGSVPQSSYASCVAAGTPQLAAEDVSGSSATTTTTAASAGTTTPSGPAAPPPTTTTTAAAAATTATPPVAVPSSSVAADRITLHLSWRVVVSLLVGAAVVCVY